MLFGIPTTPKVALRTEAFTLIQAIIQRRVKLYAQDDAEFVSLIGGRMADDETYQPSAKDVARLRGIKDSAIAR